MMRHMMKLPTNRALNDPAGQILEESEKRGNTMRKRRVRRMKLKRIP